MNEIISLISFMYQYWPVVSLVAFAVYLLTTMHKVKLSVCGAVDQYAVIGMIVIALIPIINVIVAVHVAVDSLYLTLNKDYKC